MGANPSALFFADSGRVAFERDERGIVMRYELSTRRSALLGSLLPIAVGAMVARASIAWAIGVWAVLWLWLVGWNYVAQSLRADTLFQSLATGLAPLPTH
jgi:hypothetical protein